MNNNNNNNNNASVAQAFIRAAQNVAQQTAPEYKDHRKVLLGLSRQHYFTLHVPRKHAEQTDLQAALRLTHTPAYTLLLKAFPPQQSEEVRHAMCCIELASYECAKMGAMGSLIFLPEWRTKVAATGCLTCQACGKTIDKTDRARFFDCCLGIFCRKRSCVKKHRKNPAELSACHIWDAVRKQSGNNLTKHTRSCANLGCKAANEAAFDEKRGQLILPKSNKCARCGQIGYCSKECQTADWKAFHKHECAGLVAAAAATATAAATADTAPVTAPAAANGSSKQP